MHYSHTLNHSELGTKFKVCTKNVKTLLGLVVMIQLIHPSHGGAYMVEGHLSLGLDWLAVVQSLASCVYLHTLPRIVSVRHIFLLSHVSGFGVSPYLAIWLSYC